MSPTMRILLVCAVAALARSSDPNDASALTSTLDSMLKGTEGKISQAQKDLSTLGEECSAFALDNELDQKNAVEDRDRFARKEAEHADKSDAAKAAKEGFQGQLEECEKNMDDAIYHAKKAKDLYNTQSKDYQESLFAMEQATNILSKKARNQAQAAGLLQQQGSGVHGALAQFLHSKIVQAVAAVQQPQANVDGYKSTLQPILDMIADMHGKVKEQNEDLVKGEMRREHAHNMEMKDLNGEKDRLETAISKKTMQENDNASKSASNSESKDMKNGEIASLKKAMSEKKQYCEATNSELSDAIKTHSATAQNQRKAIQALAGKSFVQKKFMSLLQTDSSNDPSRRKELMSLLVRESGDLKSSNIAMIAAAAQASPFDKVTGMITDMIAKLEQQAADEAGFKQQCDNDIRENAIARKATQADLDSLNAQKDQLVGDLGTQTSQKNKTEKLKGDTQAAMQKANQDRTNLKDENSDTVDKFTNYKGKVDKAQGFFKEAMQTGGNTNSAAAVVAVLSDLGTKFQQTVSKTENAEATQASKHKSFTETSEDTVDQADADLHELAKKMSNSNWEIKRTNKKIRATSTELSKVQDEGDDLQALCKATPITYEERAAKREAEIKALEQAYGILNEKA